MCYDTVFVGVRCWCNFGCLINRTVQGYADKQDVVATVYDGKVTGKVQVNCAMRVPCQFANHFVMM